MKLNRSFVAIMAIAALTACDDDDDPTGGDPDIAGDYEVSQFRYTDDDNASITIDLASIPPAGGGPFGITEMNVASDNSFDGTLVHPQFGEIPIGGDIDFTGGNNVRIDFNDATDELGFLDDFEDGTLELENNTITIELPDVTFNFHTINPAWPDEAAEADLRIVGTRS